MEFFRNHEISGDFIQAEITTAGNFYFRKYRGTAIRPKARKFFFRKRGNIIRVNVAGRALHSGHCTLCRAKIPHGSE